MLVRLICWTKSGMLPDTDYVKGKPGDIIQLRDCPWAVSVLGGALDTKIDVWTVCEGDWDSGWLKALKIRVEENSPAVLIRLPNVGDCLGLGKEVHLLEAARREDRKLAKMEVVDPVGADRERVVNIYAWSADVKKEAIVFPLGIDANRLELDQHEGLVAHLSRLTTTEAAEVAEPADAGEPDVQAESKATGPATSGDSEPVRVEVWDQSVCGWDLLTVGEQYTYVDDTTKAILVRHCANRTPLGLGHCIALAQGDQSGSSSAEPTSEGGAKGEPAEVRRAGVKRKRLMLHPDGPNKKLLGNNPKYVGRTIEVNGKTVMDITHL